jgi:hypothetical protein
MDDFDSFEFWAIPKLKTSKYQYVSGAKPLSIHQAKLRNHHDLKQRNLFISVHELQPNNHPSQLLFFEIPHESAKDPKSIFESLGLKMFLDTLFITLRYPPRN